MIEGIADVAPPLRGRLSRGIERPTRGAQVDNGTDGASRLAGQAHGRAEFHHRLIEIARAPAAEQRVGGLPERLACQFRSERSLQHSLNISVHDRRGRVEYDAGDGC